MPSNFLHLPKVVFIQICTVQKSINIAGLRLRLARRLNIGSRLGTGCGGVFPLRPNWEGWSSVLASTNNVDYTKYLLHFWASGTSVHAQQKTSRKNLGPWLPDGLPSAGTLQIYCCIFTAEGKKHCMWSFMGGRQQKKAYPGIPLESTCTFPLMICLCTLTMSLW